MLLCYCDGSTTWTNTYNADGLRTRRTNGSTTYSYVYNGSSLVQMTVDGSTLYFTYDASGTPQTVTYNGTTYYYATNLQGDITAILNASGETVVSYTYDAWGNHTSGSNGTGTLASNLGRHNPLRYRGYVYDTETGLYYLQSRYYNPEMGRFINADGLIATGQGILGNNMFSYCQNNPILFVDPSGCIIVLSSDATDEQIEQYKRAIAYLKTSDTAGKLIERLEKSSLIFTVVSVVNDEMQYVPSQRTIYFDVNSGLTVGDEGLIQSAALGLAHEMGHAAQRLDGQLNSSSIYDLLLTENANLYKYETPIALELGEPTRENYLDSGMPVTMNNSTHFVATAEHKRPFWHYFFFWNLFTPNIKPTEFNAY